MNYLKVSVGEGALHQVMTDAQSGCRCVYSTITLLVRTHPSVLDFAAIHCDAFDSFLLFALINEVLPSDSSVVQSHQDTVVVKMINLDVCAKVACSLSLTSLSFYQQCFQSWMMQSFQLNPYQDRYKRSQRCQGRTAAYNC
jgi:hypothetical protein